MDEGYAVLFTMRTRSGRETVRHARRDVRSADDASGSQTSPVPADGVFPVPGAKGLDRSENEIEMIRTAAACVLLDRSMPIVGIV